MGGGSNNDPAQELNTLKSGPVCDWQLSGNWLLQFRNNTDDKVRDDLINTVLVFLQILSTPAFPFSHSCFTIWISQTVYFTSEHIRLFTFYFFCFYTFLVVGSVR